MTAKINEENSLGLGSMKVLAVLLFVLFALYSDILALQVPLFAFFICPPLLVGVAAFLMFKRVGARVVLRRLFLGPPVALLIASLLSFGLSQLHDRWVMREVQDWGSELRKEKSSTGKYPVSTMRAFHGYQAAFINKSPSEPRVIYFHKFDMMRQSYSVDADRFLEESES